MLAALTPAADRLSRDRALGLARGAGRVDAGRALDAGVRREMRDAFSLRGAAAVERAQARAACRYLDFVVNRRIRVGREDPATWRVEERGQGSVEPLRRSGASFVVATGHFARHPSYMLWTGATLPQRVIGVTVRPPTARGSSLRERWAAKHLRLMLDIWGREPDVEWAYIEDKLVAASLVARLRRPGTAVLISADAPSRPDMATVHRRGFAGNAEQEFALGTAVIARAAGCPVVVCHPYLEADGTVVLEWVGPFEADGDDSDADARLTDRILDELERMIGRRPTQYVRTIGCDRRWDPEAERWEPR